MVDVSTGWSLVQEREDEYIVIYLEIATEIENLVKAGLTLPHHNPFRTLSDWYGYWSSKLPSYASRREYVRELYASLVNPIESALQKHHVDKTPPEDLIRNLAKRIEAQPERSEQPFRMRFEWLHPQITQGCYAPFEMGEFDHTIFNAMNIVKEEVRVKISAAPMDTGVGLISKTMNPQSPILLFSQVKAGQEAAHSFYRGAIGIFTSPLGLRLLDSFNPVNNFEWLALGSLLMRMLDRTA